jgi:hypothetical protein
MYPRRPCSELYTYIYVYDIHMQQEAETRTFSRVSMDFLTILPHVTTCAHKHCHVTFIFEKSCFFCGEKSHLCENKMFLM